MLMRTWRVLAIVALGVVGVVVGVGVEPASGRAATTPLPAETPVPGAPARWSEKHLFHVRYESTPVPVPLLAVHTWTITVTDAAEQPVRGANVTVLGGMPAHGHGLPTTPVVSELGDGRYRIEGLKVHMPGAWTVAFRIKASTGTDAVSFALDLP
ncbi:MAG: FixH family protein [Candidatus Binatia bacterium]